MILPLSDAPNPRGVPVITYALLAINCAIYLLLALPLSFQPPNRDDPLLEEYLRVVSQELPESVSLRDFLRQISAYDLFVFQNGFRPADPSLQTLLTSMFLHGGFLHLFGNMLFLWIYGDNVEHRLGRLGFLFWYLATGVAATFFHFVFNSGSQLPVVGASGAISGVLGFYFIWFPRNTVRLWVLLFPFFMNVIELRARIVLGFYLLLDNLLPFLITRGQAAGVAHGAHIGGFLAGLAAAWVMERHEIGVRPAEYREAKAPPEKTPVPELLREALERRDFAAAAELYFSIEPDATRRLLSPENSLRLAYWLVEQRHPQAALILYRRHLRDYPQGPGVAEAHVGAGLVQLYALGQVAPAYQHFVEALDFNPSPEIEAQARAALQVIAERQKYRVGRPRVR
jgi:membrane associated rhomboid family serine protease